MIFQHLHWSAVLFLLDRAIGSEEFLTYGAQKESLWTLEGSASEQASPPHVNRERVKRFLSFNNDQSNIRIEMVFAVPFLHIPIGGKTVEGPYGNSVTPVVDVNAKSLITASVLLFMLFFVIPKLVRVFIPAYPQGRAFDNSESEWARVVRGVENTLHVNTTACWQQSVCHLMQTGSHHTPSGWGRLVDSVVSATWFEQMTTGTSFGEALYSARTDEKGCDPFYAQCPLGPEKLKHFAKELARRYMNHLIQLSNNRNGFK